MHPVRRPRLRESIRQRPADLSIRRVPLRLGGCRGGRSRADRGYPALLGYRIGDTPGPWPRQRADTVLATISRTEQGNLSHGAPVGVLRHRNRPAL